MDGDKVMLSYRLEMMVHEGRLRETMKGYHVSNDCMLTADDVEILENRARIRVAHNGISSLPPAQEIRPGQQPVFHDFDIARPSKTMSQAINELKAGLDKSKPKKFGLEQYEQVDKDIIEAFGYTKKPDGEYEK